MKNNYYAVIMAGGVGSRLWPVSTENNPKQFHDLLGTGESLLQKTFYRINQLVPSKNILIATNQRYKELILKQLPEISSEQLLLEPTMRNTAPCILYAALKIRQQNENAVMLVAPSDHWIENETEFLKNIETSFNACSKEDILMTLGIQPNHPNTGYGYIQFEENTSEIKKVQTFTEKPNLEKATQFLASGDYLWNAGIFVWSVSSILHSFKKHLPEMVNILETEDNVYNTNFEDDFIKSNYEKCENISIDFGIMERSEKVHVLPVDFGWDDLGTWGSLYNKLDKDTHQNATVGATTIFKDANGNMVSTKNGKKVVVQGLQDFIIVEKDDVLVICPRKDEQDIKQLRTEAKEQF
ncbi:MULTISPECIES: mannose-1-phosphate guanylyltransferase [Tenacibaculum]|uniref:Mannose-1-phosphate guanylyltransferase n=1 Tax=Tenacibaculum mesophilum TaxID=104268 RepID=A0ABM7CEA1_9FLAO|nr:MULTISPECIES: mannose-1-phosphate guanylyltransferase [Tenacibaculum]AZJ32098.1 mannose-1-phosphate guanylyltransferase [Tenacibaculum mesophilum]MCG7502868.1 mannose-1-phosphate guanylyltransferase [Tenacibaculum sp. Mcav3-52]QFS27357.1 mannose-1-phosphate guanylyltransferase [Tenacibaculum mesophilum]SHF89855.1 mannose-1-phosphate guanylyltransferase [Tenacibaculum mesophilum]